MPANTYYLRPGEVLWADQRIVSPNGRYMLVYQGDGNLVLYKRYPSGYNQWLWDSATNGAPVHGTFMQGDGNLVIYAADGSVVWATNRYGSRAQLEVQDDGNLVIYRYDRRAIWSTGTVQPPVAPMGPRAGGATTYPGQALYPNDSLRNGPYTLLMQTDGNLVLYRTLSNGQRAWMWDSATNGRSVEVCYLHSDGNLVLYGPDGRVVWATHSNWGPNAQLELLADGNLRIRRPDNVVVWATNTTQYPLPDGPRAQRNVMHPGEVLYPGDSIMSDLGRYTLTYQTDGNLVLYKNFLTGYRTATWSTQTYGAPGRAQMHPDGNLIVWREDGVVMWKTHTYLSGVNGVLLQDDGNLVAYAGGSAYWASNTAEPPLGPVGPYATGPDILPREIMYNGQKLTSANGVYTLEFTTGGDFCTYRRLSTGEIRYLWFAGGTGGRNARWAVLKPDGNLVVLDNAQNLLWQSGTADQGVVKAVLENDGRFVLRRADGSIAFETPAGETLPGGPDAQGDRILPGQVLRPGHAIHSGRYMLEYQTDGNLVLYKTFSVGDRQWLWDSNTGGWTVGVCKLHTDGRFAVHAEDGHVVWSTPTQGAQPQHLVLQGDGNLVLYGSGGAALWATDTVQALSPGELAERWAPEVRLHPDDEYRPASVDWFLPRARLEHGGEVILNVGQVTAESLVSQTDAGESSGGDGKTSFKLRPHDEAARRGSLANAHCYVHIREAPNHPGETDIQYWFFYPHNGEITLSLPLGSLVAILNPILGVAATLYLLADRVDHEGDWEHVTVRVNAQGQLVGMYFSAHDGEGRWLGAAAVPRNADGRPIVYSAKHSHASYPRTGEWHRPGFLEYFAPDETEAGGPVWPTWQCLRWLDQDVPAWRSYNGRWGETGALPGTDGPYGAWLQDAWNEDLADGLEGVYNPGGAGDNWPGGPIHQNSTGDGTGETDGTVAEPEPELAMA